MAAATTFLMYGPQPAAWTWACGGAIAGTWMGSLTFFKTRDPRHMGAGAGEYKRVLTASGGAFGVLAVAFQILQVTDAAAFFLVTLPAGTVALLVARWLWRQWLTAQRERTGRYLSRVIVLGAQDDVAYVTGQLRKKTGAAYQVVGVALEDPASCPDGMMTGTSAGAVKGSGGEGIPVVAGLDDIPGAVRRYGADAVIVAGQVGRGNGYVRELGWALEATGTELVLALALTNVAGPRIRMRPVEGLPLMHVDLPSFSGYRHYLKRTVDVVLSGLALVVLSPLFAILAILIRRDSEGGAIFRQRRVCRDGDTFEMLKFRSMVATAEAELEQLKAANEGSGPLFKLHDDPRVTRVGKVLRKYSLDELPQLVNVFKGHMSLVGPRPPLPTEVADYDGTVRRRLFTKPGVTGLWQVNGRSDLSWEESVRLDLYYVENWSLTGDLMIMWQTVKVMLKPVGAY